MSTYNIAFSIQKKKKKKITIIYPKSAASGIFERTIEKFKRVMVNKPSGFKPVKVYCTILMWL